MTFPQFMAATLDQLDAITDFDQIPNFPDAMVDNDTFTQRMMADYDTRLRVVTANIW